MRNPWLWYIITNNLDVINGMYWDDRWVSSYPHGHLSVHPEIFSYDSLVSPGRNHPWLSMNGLDTCSLALEDCLWVYRIATHHVPNWKKRTAHEFISSGTLFLPNAPCCSLHPACTIKIHSIQHTSTLYLFSIVIPNSCILTVRSNEYHLLMGGSPIDCWQ